MEERAHLIPTGLDIRLYLAKNVLFLEFLRVRTLMPLESCKYRCFKSIRNPSRLFGSMLPKEKLQDTA